MALRGDFVALKNAIVKIKKLRNVVPETARLAAPELRALVEQEFATGTNPYGTAWKPLRPSTLKRHGPPPLTASGAMRGGVTVEASGTDIVFTAPSPAFLHQYGWRRKLPKTRKIKRKGQVVGSKTHGTGGPARPIFPNGRVPDKWRQLIRRIARRVVTGEAGQ